MAAESITHWQDLETATRAAVTDPMPAELRVPGLTVLAHPDVRRVGECAALAAPAPAGEVRLSRLEPLFAAPGGERRRPLGDPHLSRCPWLLVPEPEGGMRLAAGDCRARLAADGRPVTGEAHFTAAEITRGVVLLLAERVALLLHLLDPLPPRELPRFGLVGDSRGVQVLRQQIARVADVEVPVLLRGATGTGKELVAAAIHGASGRSAAPFVAVNMAAIPPELAAAELFGAARGAFTGADRRRSGYFSQADRGTLFLDEVGETPVEIQVQLLRALETGAVQPLGTEKPQTVDVRIVTATDSQLETEIAAGRFRAPLLHRIAGYEIHLPALAERRDDLGRLLFHFLRRELEGLGEAWRLDDPARPWLAAPAVARLARYSWPGNVRQLRNVAQQLVIGNRGAARARLTPEIEAALAREVQDRATGGDAPPPPLLPVGEAAGPAAEEPAPAAREERRGRSRPAYRPAGEVGDEELTAALRACEFRLQPTAAALGVSRTALYALIDASPRVRKARDLEPDEIERCRERCGGDLDAMAAVLEVSRRGLRIRMTQLGLP